MPTSTRAQLIETLSRNVIWIFLVFNLGKLPSFSSAPKNFPSGCFRQTNLCSNYKWIINSNNIENVEPRFPGETTPRKTIYSDYIFVFPFRRIFHPGTLSVSCAASTLSLRDIHRGAPSSKPLNIPHRAARESRRRRKNPGNIHLSVPSQKL